MDVLELTGFGGAERTGRNHTQSLGIGFGDLNGAVGIDLFQNGNMAVRAIGIGLARSEHHSITDMARSVVHPIAQSGS